MLRDRLLPFLRRVVQEWLVPTVRRCVRLTGREQAAVAVALFAFLLVAARRYRGWL